MSFANSAHLQIQPALTRRVLLGQAAQNIGPGETLFPAISTGGGPKVEYIEWDPALAVFKELDVRRGPTQAFTVSRPDFTTHTAVTGRLGHGSLWDDGELANANASLQLPLKISEWGRRKIQGYKEGILSEVAQDTASFAVGHDITIPTGEGWHQTNGDPRGVIQTGADLLYQKVGLQKNQLTLFLSRRAHDRLQQSPDLREYLVNVGNFKLPDSLSAMAQYLGIKRAWSTPWQRLDTATDLLDDAYEDIAILYAEQGSASAAGLNTSLGSGDYWAVNWVERSPFAAKIQQPERTSQLWTWTDFFLPAIINVGAAALILNIDGA